MISEKQKILFKVGINLDLSNFKTKLCPKLNENHNKKTCYFYHQYFDKRRDLNKIKYSENLCSSSEGKCQLGDKCKNSHNKIELFYHPKNYKKKYCIDFLTKDGFCEFGKYCSFAHSKEELQIDILENYKFNYNFFIFKYKTENCPLLNFEHDKNLCVYSHSIQDFRRTNMMNLNTRTCKNWKTENNSSYKENCKNGFNCKFCHGFKEYDYHPLVFKTKPCYLGKDNCKFGANCHFYHYQEEQREFKELKNGLIYTVSKLVINEQKNLKIKLKNKKKLNPNNKEFIIEEKKLNPNNKEFIIEEKKMNLKDKLRAKLNKNKLFKQMSTNEFNLSKRNLVLNNLE